MDESKVLRRIAIVGFFGFFGLLMLWLSWYTVPEGFRGVVTRNNAVIGIAEPGLGFKMPFIDGVTDMSTRTEKVQWESVMSYSKDVQASASVVAINLRLGAESVRVIYSTVGTDYAEKIVYPALLRRYKEAFGRYTAAEIVNQRAKLGDEITLLMQTDMSERGIVIEAVQIQNIDFSDTYELAIESAAKAEAEVKTARQQLEQVKVSSQQKIAQAEADAQAIRLNADANAYARRVQGEAEAWAIAARGKALRDNPDLIALTAAERWSGILPTSMVPSGAVPFLMLPTPQ